MVSPRPNILLVDYSLVARQPRMDEIHSSFGRLSTQAPEWKPRSNSLQSQQTTESDLNPAAVKEFVPGQGWTATVATGEGFSTT